MLKSDAQEASMEDCLSMLRQVSAKTHTRIDLPDSGRRLGFIAQDMLAACPSTWSTAQYSRKQGGTGTEIRTLDYARLSAVLWQCTRSLLARVETLEAKLAQ